MMHAIALEFAREICIAVQEETCQIFPGLIPTILVLSTNRYQFVEKNKK